MSWVLAPAEELLPVLVAKPTMLHQKSAHRSAQGRQRHACSCERGQVTKKSEHLVKSNKPAVTRPCINNQRMHVVIDSFQPIFFAGGVNPLTCARGAKHDRT